MWQRASALERERVGRVMSVIIAGVMLLRTKEKPRGVLRSLGSPVSSECDGA